MTEPIIEKFFLEFHFDRRSSNYWFMFNISMQPLYRNPLMKMFIIKNIFLLVIIVMWVNINSWIITWIFSLGLRGEIFSKLLFLRGFVLYTRVNCFHFEICCIDQIENLYNKTLICLLLQNLKQNTQATIRSLKSYYKYTHHQPEYHVKFKCT